MLAAVEIIDSTMLEELVAFSRPFERDALSRWPALPQPSVDALVGSWQKRLEQGGGVAHAEPRISVYSVPTQCPLSSSSGPSC